MFNDFFYYFLISFCFLSCSDNKSVNPSNSNDFKDNNYFETLKDLKTSNFSKDSLQILVKRINNDSLRNEIYFDLAYHFYKKNDSLNFRELNNKSFDLSLNQKDTIKMALSYWDLANFFYQRNQNDSSYFYYNKAYNFYELKQNNFMGARMLLNMAIIQKDIKDYVGSEASTIKAIKKIKPLKKNKHLYMAYNNLGIIYNQLGEFDLSLKYHNTALQYEEKIKSPLNRISTLNNIGVAFHNKGKLTEAIETYKKALSIDSIFYNDPDLYAMLLDNLAHAKLTDNDTLGTKKLFLEALKIREELEHEAGIVINKLHLSEYFLKEGDTAGAIKYAREAKLLAEQSTSYDGLLESMLLLSKIDKANSNRFLNDYIRINDSLQRKERSIRNNFARIRFETDQFIAENTELNVQKNRILYGASGVVLFLGLLVVIRTQKVRNKELKLDKKQQKANEDIYNLLLEQQNKIEEGRYRVKKRISEELHDGVLSQIFGIRFVLAGLNNKIDPASIQTRENYLGELKAIEEEVRNIAHDLNKDFLSSEKSFLTIIEELLEKQKDISGFVYSIENDADLEWDKINSKIKINLYRIIQEAVQNINKYAAASNVDLTFEKLNDSLKIKILDNGCGFNVEKSVEGIGIKNLRSRVKDLNGSISIISGKQGTNIFVSLPLN